MTLLQRFRQYFDPLRNQLSCMWLDDAHKRTYEAGFYDGRNAAVAEMRCALTDLKIVGIE